MKRSWPRPASTSPAKTTKTRLPELLLASLLVASPALAQQASKAPSKSKNKSQASGSYQIESSAKGLSVLKDGILSGAVGETLSGRIGLNEILVTAPNHALRKIRFWIKPGETTKVRIVMRPVQEPEKLSWKTSMKRFNGEVLNKKSSYCLNYRKKTGETYFCDRSSLLDDIVYADASLFHQDDLRDYQGSGDFAEFRKILPKIASNEATPAIEAFLARHPEQASAYQLAGFHSLMRGDCPRVQSLATEYSQYKTPLPSLDLYRAVCAEAQNDKALRDQILAESLKGKSGIEPIAYWAGLLAIDSSPAKANEYAVACLKSRSNDTRCSELLNMALKAQGKLTKTTDNDFEDAFFKSFLSIEDRLPKGQQEALYFETSSLIEQYPIAIENYLTLAWINTTYDKELADDDYIRLRIQVAKIKGGGTLDKIVESVEKANLTQLLPPIYKRRLAFSPEDPNLWYRLIRSYSKGNQCADLLEAFKEGAAYLPKFNPSLLQMRGSCEMDLNRFPEAVATYKKVMDVNPRVWSSPYNLANAYERSEKKSEAYGYFKKALELNPPDDVVENIQARLKFLEPAAQK